MNFVFNFCFGPQKILFYFKKAATRRDTEIRKRMPPKNGQLALTIELNK